MATSKLYTDQLLESLRQLTDPLADEAVSKMFQQGQISQVNSVFSALVRNNDLPELEDYNISAYLNKSAELPEDIDYEKVELAQKVFLQYGPTMFLVLFCKSLPECYSCAKGAEVLVQTGKMTSEAEDYQRYSRRLMETAQFFVNVLEANGLRPEGKGIASAQKVRLIHATIRHYLRQSGWDEEDFDAPINQEDMLGTLLSFSVTIIEGLDKLGALLTNAEREAYYYHWSIVGQLMGLAPKNIPATLQDAIELKRRILEHQMKPSEAGKTLTKAAIDYMSYMIPGKGFDSFPTQLMLFLLDPEVSETVGLRKDESLKSKIALTMLKVGTEIQSRLGDTRIFQSAAKAYEMKFMEAIFKHFNEHKKVGFFIPPGLKEFWSPTEGKESSSSQPMAAALESSRVAFPASNCHEVVPQLERLIGRCRVENNAIGFFASLYRLTTLKIVKAVGDGIFDDNERMGRMDLVFARRYLDAVTAYFNREKASAAWEVAFSVALDSNVNVVQHLLLGMNAHINLDLAIAAAQIAPGDQIHTFKNDFDKINGILKSLMDMSAQDISEIWPPLKGMLLLGEWVGKPLVGLSMVQERKHAWDKALKLAALSGEELAEAIDEMDKATAHLSDEVLHPDLLVKPLFWAISKGEKGSVSWQIDQFHNDLGQE